ncbi:MAG: hypothetical protein WDZ79_01840 [Candidatus Paceibacterota bacterium]
MDQKYNNIQTEDSVGQEMPTWFTIYLRIYAVLLILFSLFTLWYISSLLLDQYHSLFTETSFPPFSTIFFVSAPLALLAYIIYGVGVFKIRRWTVPLTIFLAVISIVTSTLRLFNQDYETPELAGVITALLLLVVVGIGTWMYRKRFKGNLRYLQLQIPILIILIPVTTFFLLGQIFTDDPAVHDSDLVLPEAEILAEDENAYYTFPKRSELSPAQQEAFSQILKQHKALDGPDVFNMQEAEIGLETLEPIIARFIEASEKPSYQCPTSINSFTLDTTLCKLNHIRDTGLVLSVHSYVMARQENSETALESALAVVRFGHTMSTAEQPEYIDHLVSMALVQIGLESVERALDETTPSPEIATRTAQELKTYTFDGSALERALKRHHLVTKNILSSLTLVEGYH